MKKFLVGAALVGSLLAAAPASATVVTPAKAVCGVPITRNVARHLELIRFGEGRPPLYGCYHFAVRTYVRRVVIESRGVLTEDSAAHVGLKRFGRPIVLEVHRF